MIGAEGHLRVVGAGLIGTSIGLKVIELGRSVSMVDVNPHAEGLSNALMGRWSSVGQTPDIVVVSVPPQITARVIADQLDLYPQSIVLETSSTKTNVELELRTLSVDISRVVLTHPISGREVNGPAAARADLFLNRAWLISPLTETSEEAVEKVESLIRELGSTPYRVDCEEHDHLLSIISHLPQVLSTVMAREITQTGSRASLAGQGLRDVTRLADSDPKLWIDILLANRNRVVASLESVTNALEEMKNAIESDNKELIMRLFEEGRTGRSLISGKHGSVARDYSLVQVIIPDQPGALAKVFYLCNEAGINIEDLALEHSPAQETGLLTISVNPQQESLLERTLVESNFIFFFKEKR